MSSVDSSTRVDGSGLSSMRSPSICAATPPISASGCRTVVIGGEAQRVTGRSSKPTTLRSLRYPQAADARGLVDAESLLVAAGEDRRWRLGLVEQLRRAGEAALVGEVAVAYERGVVADTGPVEGRTVPVKASQAAQRVSGAGDRRDPAVAKAKQVLGRRDAPGPVGGAHAGDAGRGRVGRVDDDERDRGAAELADVLLGQPGGHQDHAARVVAGHGRRPARRASATVPHGRDGDSGLVRGTPFLDAAQDLHRPRAVQAREHKVDEASPAVPPRAGPRVVVLVEKPLHPGARLRRDIRAAIDDLGHGGQGDASRGGDSGERGLSLKHPAALAEPGGPVQSLTRGWVFLRAHRAHLPANALPDRFPKVSDRSAVPGTRRPRCIVRETGDLGNHPAAPLPPPVLALPWATALVPGLIAIALQSPKMSVTGRKPGVDPDLARILR